MKTSKLDVTQIVKAGKAAGAAWTTFTPEEFNKGLANGDAFEAIDTIRSGFPYTTVDNILNRTSLSRQELSDILHLSTRQMNRYQPEDLLPAEQSGFVYEFSRLYVRGEDVFGDAGTFEGWLRRPQQALGARTPMSLLDTTEGYRLVNDLLSQIEYGFYS